MITCITPTGDRSEAFELCTMWMKSQRKQPDQWIVIDDGYTPLSENLKTNCQYIRREPKENEGFTLTLNLRTAIPYIKYDKILIIEDDDWYGPDYISVMNHYLKKYDLIGEMFARYYHITTMKHSRVINNKHASLCQTGFTSKILSKFISCLDGDPYVDIRFWESETGYLIDDSSDLLKLHCAIKGLKGRNGIGTGHKEDSEYFQVDNGLKTLISWVGEENARIYMNHIGMSFESATLIEGQRDIKDRVKELFLLREKLLNKNNRN